MFKSLKKYWRYLSAKVSHTFDKNADPEIQLEQAITEAKSQHRKLRDQATTVIANQKKAEMELNSKMEELEKLNAQTRQAVTMAQEAQTAGDTAKADQFSQTAEVLAGRLVEVEQAVESQKQLVLNATEAAGRAKAAVEQNTKQLQQRVSEKSKLLSKLDQAKMQEQMNSAMEQLSDSVDDDVPTLKEVEDKINARYAKAAAATELTESSVDSRMLEVEQATNQVAAQSRLAQIRNEMGLPAGDASAKES